MPAFTDPFIRSLHTHYPPLQRVYEKGTDKGFHVRILREGSKQFGIAYTIGGNKRFMTLGIYSKDFGIKKARAKCREVRNLIDQGIDPQLERDKRAAEQEEERKRIEQQKREDEAAVTVNHALDHYLESVSHHTRTDAGNLFTNQHCNVREEIGDLKIRDVTDEMIEDLLDQHISRGTRRNAGKLYAYLRAAFNKAKKHRAFMLKRWRNPFEDVIKPEDTDSHPCDRWLKEDEIKEFWIALNKNEEKIMPSIIPVLQIILLTGQRVEQTSVMKWSDIDLDRGIWDVRPDDHKTGKDTGVGHVVPLTQMAVDTLRAIKRSDESEYVFVGRHGKKHPALGTISTQLRKLINQSEIAPFTPRDIRRTCTTHWSRLNINPEIRNRTQAHALKGDIESKHYNRYDYLTEKRTALVKWERELMRIVGISPEDNVVILRA